jgi:hypothetical protein
MALAAYYIEQCRPNLDMCARNFLVDKEACSYNILYSAGKRLSAGQAVTERAAMFPNTAARGDRLDISPVLERA